MFLFFFFFLNSIYCQLKKVCNERRIYIYIFIYDSIEKIKGKLLVKLLTKIIDYIVLKKGIEMKNIFIYYLIIINNY